MFWDIIRKVDSSITALGEGLETSGCRYKIGVLSSFDAAVILLVFMARGKSERKKVLDKYVHKACTYFDTRANLNTCDYVNLEKIEEHIEWLVDSRIYTSEGDCAYYAIESCLRYYASVIYKNNGVYTIDAFTQDLVEFFSIAVPKDYCEYSCLEDIVAHLYHHTEHGRDFLTKEMRKRNHPHYVIGFSR